MTILLKRNRCDSPAVEVQITVKRYAKHAYISIRTPDGLDISIGSTRQELLDELYRLQAIIKTITVAEAETGIIQGEAEVEEPKHFNLITADDLEGCSIGNKLALLIERFSQSRIDDLDPDLSLVEALKADYKAHTGHEYRSDNDSQSTARSSDLSLIKPIVPEIFDDQNETVWGAQQRVAEALGLPGTGGAYRKRILDVLEAAKQYRQRNGGTPDGKTAVSS